MEVFVAKRPHPRFETLLQRLKDHVEHGRPLEETELMLAQRQPAALAHVALLMGNLSRHRNRRVGGKPTAGLTNDAKAYKRANNLAMAICIGLYAALHGKLPSVVTNG